MMGNFVKKWAVSLAILSAACVMPQTALGSQWVTGWWVAETSMPVSAFPWNKYTHVVYGAIGAGGSCTVDPLNTSQPNMANIVAGAHANGKKITVSLGDGNGSLGTDTSSGCISTFVTNLVSFLNTNGFDGVDLDWEGSAITSQYDDLISRLRTALGTGRLITTSAITTSQVQQTMVDSYSKLDQINVECFDMDGVYLNGGARPWYNDAILNGPLTVGQGGTCQEHMFSFTSRGIPAAKLGVGIPFYGRHWTGATHVAQGTGTEGSYITYANLVGLSTFAGNQHWDSTYESDYLSLTATNEFYSYNGIDFMPVVAAWAKSNGFGGFMVFEEDYEYISSQTGDGRYPLSTALASAVLGSNPVPNPPTVLIATVQ